MASKSILTVNRVIEFYRIKQLAKGMPEPDANAIAEALITIEQKDRWLEIKSNRERLHCWHHKGKKLNCYTIGITRSRARGGIVNQNGDLRGQELEEGSDACEYSHLVHFPNNIVGFEFNHHGPRLTQFTEFLDGLVPNLGRLTFEPIFFKDFKKRLENKLSFSSIKLTINRGNLSTARSLVPDINLVKKKDLDLVSCDEVEIRFKAKKRNQAQFGTFVKSFIKDVIKQPDAKETMRQLRLGFYGQSDNETTRTFINLLNEKIVCTKTIDLISLSNKSVQSQSAFKAIREAFDEKRDELEEGDTIEV